MLRKALLATFTLLLVTPSTALAGPFEDGVEAYERGDFAMAAQIWMPLAEQGDPAAQFNIGLMYDNGRGVPKDDSAAVLWYRRAAEQGYAKAQFSLGSMYERGEGIAQDLSTAAKWFRRAADQRNAKARFRLGYLYERGRGVKKDYGEATKLYTQAAEQGLPDAQIKLGSLYALGEVERQDFIQAYVWFSLATISSRSGEIHDKAIQNRDLLAHKMTTDQLTKARKLFNEWKPSVTP
jgi:hypothetical protein